MHAKSAKDATVTSGRSKCLVEGARALDSTTWEYCRNVLLVGEPLHFGNELFLMLKNSTVYGDVYHAFRNILETEDVETSEDFFKKEDTYTRNDGMSLGLTVLDLLFHVAFFCLWNLRFRR